jgi:hypothetical protein
MNHYLILRLTNAAIDLDQRGQGNLAALITEAIDELSKEKPLAEGGSGLTSYDPYAYAKRFR